MLVTARNLVFAEGSFDEDVHAAEVSLITRHTPLVSLRDDPAVLLQLSAVRALCCEIAVATP